MLLLVDDAQHLQGEGIGFVGRLIAEVPAPHRLVLLGRNLPRLSPGRPELAALARLDGHDLSFTPEEIEQYLFESRRLRVSDFAITTIRRATGGWPAAIALWASAITSSSEAEATIERLATQRAGLGTLVESLLDALDPLEAEMSCQLAHLPLLSPQAARAVTGMAGLHANLEGAGLPFVESAPGWTRLGDPVAEYLSSKHPLDPALARRAALSTRTAAKIPLLWPPCWQAGSPRRRPV